MAGNSSDQCKIDNYFPAARPGTGQRPPRTGTALAKLATETVQAATVTHQVLGLLYSPVNPHRAQGKGSQALIAAPPAASGSDEAWLALEIDADACTAAPGGAPPDPAKSAP